METVTLADAKDRLEELVDLVAAGETVEILAGGKAVAQLSSIRAPRRPIDRDRLRTLTSTLPPSPVEAGQLVRSMRDGDRY